MKHQLLLFSAIVPFFCAASAMAATCTPTPECAAQGYKYSEEECPHGALKCPNGDGYYCATPRPKCNIGDIFYTDNTCVAVTNHNSSKTVLGIVVYVNADGVGGQIMAPWLIDENGNRSSSPAGMYWSTEEIDVPGLPNMTSTTLAEADFDSCGNTDKIVAAGNASDYPAAWATRKYAPTTETAGKWCLPAAGVLRNIQKNWVTIYTAVNTVGGADIENSRVWSSSEHAGNDAWQAIISGGDLYFIYKYGIIYYVVPVLEF